MSYWTVAYTDAQAEPNVCKALERQGFGTFLPCYLTGSWYRNRLSWTERPLLPRYLFVHLTDGAAWGLVAQTYGVNRVLLCEGAPAHVPAADLTELMLAHADGRYNVIRSPTGKFRKQRRRRRRPRHGKVATGKPCGISAPGSPALRVEP